MSLSQLPVEILIEVLSNLDPTERRDLNGILNLRRSCRGLNKIIISFLRGKLDLRLGVTPSELDERIALFWRCPEGVRAWYFGIVLDVSNALDEEPDGTPFPPPPAAVVRYLLTSARFVRAFARQLTRLQVLVGEIQFPDVASFRKSLGYTDAVWELLRYFGQGPYVGNLTVLRAVSGDMRHGRELVRAMSPFPGGPDNGESFPPRFEDSDAELQEILGPTTSRNALFSRIKTIDLNRGPCGDSSSWVVDLALTPLSASLREKEPPYTFSHENGYFPSWRSLQTDRWELGMHTISTMIHKPAEITLKIRDLRLRGLKIWNEYYHDHEGTASPACIALLLDILFPALKNLEFLRIEGMQYICQEHTKDEEDTPMAPPPNACEDIMTLPGSSYLRPIISPFPEDYNALRRLRDAYVDRRASRGLPVDEWSEFLADHESEVFKAFPANISCPITS